WLIGKEFYNRLLIGTQAINRPRFEPILKFRTYLRVPDGLSTKKRRSRKYKITFFNERMTGVAGKRILAIFRGIATNTIDMQPITPAIRLFKLFAILDHQLEAGKVDRLIAIRKLGVFHSKECNLTKHSTVGKLQGALL